VALTGNAMAGMELFGIEPVMTWKLKPWNPVGSAITIFAVAVIVSSLILLLCGGRLAELARAAWADGTVLEALVTLAIGAAVAALLAEAVRE